MARKRDRGPTGKGDAGASEGNPRSAGQELRAALEELTAAPGKDAKKRRHVDDYQEFSVDGSDENPLSQALAELTQDAYQRRERLLPDEPKTMSLREDRDAKTPQRLADTVMGEMDRDMRDLGISPSTHYYAASERRETGEVDRTYDVGGKSRRACRGRNRKPPPG